MEVSHRMWCSVLLHKEREVNEKFRKVYDTMQLEVVLGLEQRKRHPWVQRGVKGHGVHFISNVPAAIFFILLVGITKSPPERERERECWVAYC